MMYTADVLVVDTDGRLLLIKRKYEPYANQWALPGGHVDPQDAVANPGSPSRAAAVRELAEETRVVVPPSALQFVGTFDRDGRDPRGPYSTDAYLVRVPTGTRAVARDDAAEVEWLWIGMTTYQSLAFDHNEIVKAALSMGFR